MSASSLRRAMGLLAVIGILSALTGCIAVGGNDNYYKPTLGRQLMDLKTARDTGAISDREYEQVKGDLLRGRVSSARAH